jgi:hypothetical protein
MIVADTAAKQHGCAFDRGKDLTWVGRAVAQERGEATATACALLSGAWGMEVQAPSPLNFHPW